VAKKTVMLTPAEKAKRKYEAEKRGKVVLRVQLGSTDDAVQWEKKAIFSNAFVGANESQG